MARFVDFETLANASYAEVLRSWSGLGYNRRAGYMHEAARAVVRRYGGILPDDPGDLETLPGIGAGTAGSIVAFAYNAPVVFIETNIRRVFIHHFFSDRNNVRDREILPLIGENLDKVEPRKWYWALMDYGVVLARQGRNPNRKSAHYTVQSRFEGSNRQLRGIVIRDLLRLGSIAAEDIPRYGEETGIEPSRVFNVLKRLEEEGVLTRSVNGEISIRR